MKVVDTKVSAENEIYTVCLNVVEEDGEVRANVPEFRRCVDVTVNNTNGMKIEAFKNREHIVLQPSNLMHY